MLVFAVVLSSTIELPESFAQFNPEKVQEELIDNVPLRLPCRPLEETEKRKNKVVIQLNNVQSYADSDLIIQMIKDANELNIPLVLSVIPENIIEDKKLVRFLQDNNCRVEIAQQGSRFSEKPEFMGMNKEQRKERAIEGKSILQWTFKKEVTTFVPPFNWYDWSVISALDEVGYKTISVEGWLRKVHGVMTYSFYRQSLVNTASIVNQCKSSFASGRTCVVIIYPYTFKEDYSQFTGLLDTLSSQKDVELTTFEEILTEEK